MKGSEQIDFSPVRIFCSYAHRDEQLKNLLLTHLSPMQREGLITAWHDAEISAGEEWREEIEHRLNTSEVILLLISPDFFASTFCYGIEMQRALARHDSCTAVVVPIILRPCDWQSSPVGRLQALPPQARPITSWPNRDEAMEATAKGLRSALARLSGKDQKRSASGKDRNRNRSLSPLCTPLAMHSTSGASAITTAEHPRVKGAALGPVDLEFEVTNINREQMSLHEILVEVVEYEEARLLRRLPYLGIGETRRYECTVQPKAGNTFKCTTVEGSYDFIKLSEGELERFRVTVDASTPGLYKLGVTINYSVAGIIGELKVGTSKGFAYLGQCSATDVILLIAKALNDSDPIVRRDAALELCKYKQSEGRFSNWDNTKTSSLEITSYYPHLLQALLDTLNDSDEGERRDAARFLGDLKDANAVPKIVDAVLNGKLGSDGVEALGRIGQAALPALSDFLHDSDTSRRRDAARAMSDVGIPAISDLKPATSDPSESVRRVAAESLGKIGVEAVIESLVGLLNDPSETVRFEAARSLGRTKSPLALQPLRDSLRNGNKSAAGALSCLRPPDVEGLAKALDASELAIRLAALSGIDNLTWLFTDHPSTTAFEERLPSLQRTLLNGLENALRDEYPEVRRSVTALLARIGKPAMKQLGYALQDEDEQTQTKAGRALADIGISALPTLIQCLNTPNLSPDLLFRIFYRLGQPAREALRSATQCANIQDPQAAASVLLRRIDEYEASINTMLREDEMERLPCQQCGASILPATAKRTGGICMPCFQKARDE